MYSRNVFFYALVCGLLILTVHTTTAQQIVGTERHTSMLCSDGSVYGWTDYNLDGLLGNGTTEGTSTPVRAMVESISSIYSGLFSMIVVDKSGNVWAWGGNGSNKFGMPSWNYQELTPQRIPHFTEVKKAIVNDANTICLLHNGQVKVSGNNRSGGYGNGTTIDIDSGSVLVPLDSVVDVFCAIGTTFAVRVDGTIYAWGNNTTNLVDSSDNYAVSTPVVKLRTNGVISASGSFGGLSNVHGCMKIVTLEGDVYVWGWNNKNQLGFEKEQYIVTPRKLSLPKKAKAVAGGDYHTIVLYEDGTVATFGDNEKGQLGNPSVINSATPVNVNGLTDIVAIGASAYTSFAFKSDGTLYGWGDNENRQLNVDGASKYYQPRQIPLPCIPLSVSVQTQPKELASTPNPVYDILRVAIEPQTTTVEIYSMHGRIVHSEHTTTNQVHATINMSAEPAGIYAVVRTIGNRKTTELVVKL